jgi:hypothetical protein
MQQVKQRIGADGYADFARQASATLATSLQRERRQQVGRVVRPPGVMSQHSIETLGKDLTRAIWHIAEPSSAVDAQSHGVATPWQIEWAPNVIAVLALTQFAALRTRDSLACRFCNQHQAAIKLNDDQDNLPVR